MSAKKRPGGRKGSSAGRVTPKGTKPPQPAPKKPGGPTRQPSPGRPGGTPSQSKPQDVQHQNRRSGSRGNR